MEQSPRRIVMRINPRHRACVLAQGIFLEVRVRRVFASGWLRVRGRLALPCKTILTFEKCFFFFFNYGSAFIFSFVFEFVFNIHLDDVFA